MKYPFIIILTFILPVVAVSQNGAYIGVGGGVKIGNYYCFDDHNNTLKAKPFELVLGAEAGYRFNSFTLETGFFRYGNSTPNFSFDPVTGIPSRNGSSQTNSSMNMWAIPLRIGKEFNFCSNRMFVKPEIGLVALVMTEYAKDRWVGDHGFGINYNPADSIYIIPSDDSLRVSTYQAQKLTLALESSLSLGLRITSRADVYFKYTYSAAFNPLFYETFEYTSPYQHVNGSGVIQNAALYQVGIRYSFK